MTGKTPSVIDAPADRQAELPEVHLNRRTKICIWIILLGLANFVAYSAVYFTLGGEAIHGGVKIKTTGQGHSLHYYVLDRGDDREVSRGQWMYSATHSTSIPITVGAILLAMLTVAKDRIVSSLHSSVVRGRALITLLAVVVTVCSLAWLAWFLHTMISQLRNPSPFTGA